MFKTKVISILVIILFLTMGCKSSTIAEDEESGGNQNTLNMSSLGSYQAPLSDYFYNLDEGIEAHFLYYNAYITRGANTISNPSGLNPYLDTLNFQTFPYYIVEIEGVPDTIDYMLNITPENIDNYSTLYPLDETNASINNWCNEMLVEYEGECPDSVEVSFDYQLSLSSVTGQNVDTVFSPAIFPDILSKKEVTFDVAWTNIDSLIWESDNQRYGVVTADSTETMTSTLTDETDYFDSLIYVGIIDTNLYAVEDLMLIDRTEWERFDATYQSTLKTITLADTFTYNQIKVPEDSPMYRINGDCNQNLLWDMAEIYFDYGADWCPDSLETGEGKCAVVDTDLPGEAGYGEISDEVPCNCLGDWRNSEIVNSNWVAGSTADPNGDNWNDCGWDGYCPGHPNDTNGDENGTESNGQWDTNEGFEENIQYDFDILTSTGDYFVDAGNGVVDDEEFCVKGDDGDCDGNDPFEDRNCNGKWDDQESSDEGNGIWDDNEVFMDSNDNDIWETGEPLYVISDRLETFMVDYSNPSDPLPVFNLDSLTSITLFYGTTAGQSEYIVYNNFLSSHFIEAIYSQSFYDIDSLVTMYTNKIIEYPLPGIADDYQITKTKWYQDILGTSYDENDLDNPDYGENYGYDYHIFKTAENGDIIKMVHPSYFNYYGYYNTFDDLEINSWYTELSEEEIYIYTYNGLLRAGEYYYTDTTIVTTVADYYVENLYEVSFDSSVVVPLKKITYNVFDSGDTTCINTPTSSWLNHPDVDVIVEAPNNCPPVDTTLTNTFKIIRTKTITMIGSGLELGLRNTIWLGSAGSDNPLGIVKDQLEFRWSEPYWEESGSFWEVISRLELRALDKTESESSILYRFFQPIKYISLNNLGNEENFNNEPYVKNLSFGIHKLRPHNEE